jgi:hypothetical protein
MRVIDMATNYGTGVIAECTDGQSPRFDTRYKDGNRPSISSVTGAIANGETITINGVFSSKRNGQLFTRIADASNVGQELVPSYVSTFNPDSWYGTGHSMFCQTSAGSAWSATGSTPIITHDTVSECYYTMRYKLAMEVYGDNAQGLQIKLERLLVSGGHDGALKPIMQFDSANGGLDYANIGLVEAGWRGVTNANMVGSNAAIAPLFNNWITKIGYYKYSSPNKKNGSVFQSIKVEPTKQQFFNFVSGGINGNDQRKSGSISPFFEPVYFFNYEGEFSSANQFWLPFYKRNSSVFKVWIDGIIGNDSPEAVWLIAGNNITTAMATGKSVHIPQISRTTSQITAKAYLGDFLPSDNIYLFVANSNGRFSSPVLVRAGV